MSEILAAVLFIFGFFFLLFVLVGVAKLLEPWCSYFALKYTRWVESILKEKL
jgi:hypothetical protein